MDNLITKLMETKGPVVKLVVLKANGETVQETVDMSPNLNPMGGLLNCTGVTFLGQYEDLQVALVMCHEKDEKYASLQVNKHILPPPIPSDEKVMGDLVLVRMNEEAEPTDFTLEEWKSFVSSHTTL